MVVRASTMSMRNPTKRKLRRTTHVSQPQLYNYSEKDPVHRNEAHWRRPRREALPSACDASETLPQHPKGGCLESGDVVEVSGSEEDCIVETKPGSAKRKIMSKEINTSIQVTYAEKYMDEVACLPAKRSRKLSPKAKISKSQQQPIQRVVKQSTPLRRGRRCKSFSPRDSLANLNSPQGRRNNKRKRTSSREKKSVSKPEQDHSSQGKERLRKRLDESFETESPLICDNDTDSGEKNDRDDDDLVRVLRRASIPHYRSTGYHIWKKLKAETCSSTSFGDGGNTSAAVNDKFTLPSHSMHNFRLVHRIVTTKVAAGLYRSAIKYCIDVLISWYAEAKDTIDTVLYERGSSDVDALRAMDSVRTGIAGMWCVFGQLLISISSKEETHPSSTKSKVTHRRKKHHPPVRKKLLRRAVSRSGKEGLADNRLSTSSRELHRRLQTAESCFSSTDIVEHAGSVIANASCCPIVGNHPWISIARSRVLFLQATAAHEDYEVEGLQRFLSSAISICRIGIYRSNPLPHLEEDRTDKCKSLDCNQVIEFLAQKDHTRCIVDDTASFCTLERAFADAYSIIPKVQSVYSQRYLFADQRGARVLCREVNRLSRLQEKLKKAVSVRLKRDVSFELSYGLGFFEHICAPDIDESRSLFASQPLETNDEKSMLEKASTRATSSHSITDPRVHVRCDPKFPDKASVPVSDGESRSESTPVLVPSDHYESLDELTNLHNADQDVEREQSTKEKAGNVGRNGQGSACSFIETIFKFCGLRRDSHGDQEVCTLDRTYATGEESGQLTQPTPERGSAQLVDECELVDGIDMCGNEQRDGGPGIACSLVETASQEFSNEAGGGGPGSTCSLVQTASHMCSNEPGGGGPGSACSLVDVASNLDINALGRDSSGAQTVCDKPCTVTNHSGFRRVPSGLTGRDGLKSFDPEGARGYSDESLMDLLDYTVELFQVRKKDLLREGVCDFEADDDFSPECPRFSGQLGVRCIFCRDTGAFGKCGSFTFPRHRSTVCRDVWFLCLEHLDSCVSMPPNVRQRYMEFRQKVAMEGDAFKEYWRNATSLLRSGRKRSGIRWKNLSHSEART